MAKELIAPRHILIIKLSAIGDVIHTLPALHLLKRKYPHAQITWLVENKAEDILKDHSLINHLIVFDRQKKNIFKLISRLRKESFDWVIDFQGTYKSALFALATGATYRIGYDTTKEPVSFFYNFKVPLKTRNQLGLERYRQLAIALGAEDSFPHVYDLAISKRDQHISKQILKEHHVTGSFFVMSVVASRRANCWGLVNFKKLCLKIVSELKVPILLVGSPADEEVCEEVHAGHQHIVNLAGQTSLKESAAILQQASLMIAGDTGPLHLAVAMDCLVLGIYGPTNPVRTGPAQDNAIIVQESLDCNPCYKRNCPLGHHNCMKDISVEEVYANVKLAIKNKGEQ